MNAQGLQSARGIRANRITVATGNAKLPSDDLWRNPDKRTGKRYARNQQLIDHEAPTGLRKVNVTLQGWFANGKVKGEITLNGERHTVVKVNPNGVWAIHTPKSA